MKPTPNQIINALGESLAFALIAALMFLMLCM